MPADPPDPEGTGLNESQQRHLLVSCQYVDTLLSDIESIVSAPRSSSPFPRYRTTLPPVQARMTADYLARIRSRLVRILDSQGIRVPPPQFDARFSIRSALIFADNAVEELRPKYMRGYGDVPDALVADIDGVVDELRTVLHRLDEYLAQDPGHDLGARIERLESGRVDTDALRLLERVITSRGLVEFRPTLAMIVDRLMAPSFEIAVFGRVSSGKSSLLNRVIGADVLPVGVTPITAVPTRLMYGDSPGLTAWFADAPTLSSALDALPDLVTERLNPGNRRHVTRIDVRYPSPRLASGVVLVDTPGLGSLATSGADETRAYLPRCDLGIVLIDAASTLTQDDLTTLQALAQTGIPAAVLLSKADLLSQEDRARASFYIEDHVRTEVGLSVVVHAVSAVGSEGTLTDRWFTSEILPMFQQHCDVALHSIRRKMVLLSDGVRASLQATAERGTRQTSITTQSFADAETALRRAGARVANPRAVAEQLARDETGGASAMLRQAAERLVSDGRAVRLASDDVTHALAQAAKDTAGARAERMRRDLEALAADVAEGLVVAAGILGRSDVPTGAELMGRVRELPALVLPATAKPLSAPGVFAINRSLRLRAIGRQLQYYIGDSLAVALSTFGAGLMAWARDGVVELQNGFHRYAEPLRVYLEQLGPATPGPSRSGDAELRSISEDLAALERVWDDGSDRSSSC